MSRLDEAFALARSEGRAALVGCLPAGFPSYDGCIAAFAAMVEGGVDVIEVELPYSDPLMDGPVIAAASAQALKQGTGTRQVLDTIRAVAATGVATILMTSWNPIERYGVERAAADLAAAGADALITPDLIPEEAGPWLAAAAEHGIAPVFLVAPSSTDVRIAGVGRVNSGFVYAASTMGVTGVRASVGSRAAGLVARVRAATDLPVAVGLGVSNREQAAEVAGFADGVVVGSAFVRCLADAPDEGAGVEAVRTLARELAAGCREDTGRGLGGASGLNRR